MNITNSPDISVLEALVSWDVSGLNPVIKLTNQSSGPNLAGVIWWVVALSPTLTPIHEGSSSTPDQTGAWTSLVLTDPWPRPFSQIEFSGNVYSVTLFAQDTNGNVYQIEKTASISRPIGNTQDSKNTYGVAATNVKVLCQQASVFFEDQTSTSYQGITGSRLASVLKVIYPLDPTYNIPTPFQISDFSSAMVPISYSSENYQFLSYSIYDYDLGNNSHVVIKYQQLATFAVLCNIDLLPLVCEVTKLVDSIESGSCSDVEKANNQLTLINPKLSMVFMGILQPLTGIDVPKLIKEIEEIGGFSCNCCSAPTGVIPATSSTVDGYTFSVVPVCGDISGTVTQVGNNIQFKLSDKTYVFNIGVHDGTTAFTVTPATSGCTKTYSLNIDVAQFASDLLTEISTNTGLVNLLNSLITKSDTLLTVNGECVFTSTQTYDYTFGLTNIPASTTFAILTAIQVGATTVPLNFVFNLANLPALQSYLNSLGLGSFVVTNPSGSNVTISSTGNTNNFSNLKYVVSATPAIASMTQAGTGYTQLSANQVVQSIINYLCALDDSQIVTSTGYSIVYVGADGNINTTVVDAGTSLNDFISQLLAAQSSTIVYGGSGSGGATTCQQILNQFPSNSALIAATDIILGTKGGQCSRMSFQDAFNFMISNMTTAGKTLFCNAVIACGAGLSCAPYNYLTPIVTPYDTSCTAIVGIETTLS